MEVTTMTNAIASLPAAVAGSIRRQFEQDNRELARAHSQLAGADRQLMAANRRIRAQEATIRSLEARLMMLCQHAGELAGQVERSELITLESARGRVASLRRAIREANSPTLPF
jgi:chromosome segregation ATPase